jgi:rhodanese-related sulfurtransferase
MKNKLFRLLYLLLFVSTAFIYNGCSEDSTTEPVVEVNESEVLVKYLEANGDFLNTACPTLIAASDLYTGMQVQKDWPVIDIRSSADFAAGHIDGAVNVTVPELINYYKNNNLQAKEKVVIACYSGQTAGWASTLLRVLGYNNVFDLKFGMASWNSQFINTWKNQIGNGRAAQFVTTNYSKPAAGSLPVLSTGKTTGPEILEARVQAVLAEGFTQTNISRDVVYQNTANYFLVNYWPVDHYNTGHIEGAVQYTPKADLKFDTALKTLPTNKPVVVYCYTGMTSAFAAAYLRLLGYDAKSLAYGVNGMNYDAMPGTKWVDSECKDYPVVP